MAMLTIVGVTAWNRTQEKLQIVQSITNPANLSMPISTSNTTPSSP
jgi:hypothetical protein